MKKNKRVFLYALCIAVLAVFYSIKISAQICTGSLGDPVVNVTFGSGNNPGPALKSSITSYNYTSNSCPDDGSYTIVNKTDGCFGATWHRVQQDHTSNDNDGYMMLINASFTPGDFYVDTVKGLCASTTYEFSSWILNALLPTACSPTPIKPKLVFNIETASGTVLGSVNTGDIASSSSAEWKQYGLFFTTPAFNNTVVIRITNNAPGGCGNDLILDDITFRPCGPVVNSTITNNNKTYIDFCKNNISSVNLSATISNGYTIPSLQWQERLNNNTLWTDIPGATSDTYLFNKINTGVYQYRLTVAEGSNINLPSCRIASNPDTITIHELPNAQAQNNSPVCEKEMLQLTGSGGNTYSWTGPNNFASAEQSPSFIAAVSFNGQYTVEVTDVFGCKALASTDAVVYPNPVAVINAGNTICEGDSTLLQCSGGTSYVWSPALGLNDASAQNPMAKPAESTTYLVTVTDNNNCSDTSAILIAVIKKPMADAGPDKVLLKGEKTILEGMASGTDVRFFWTPADFLDNANNISPLTNVPNDNTYTLHVISNAGCGSSTDQVFVKVYSGLYIPKAFTPNNDTKNETWKIEALTFFKKAVLRVYNRYGQPVFESVGNNTIWDGNFKGQPQPAGAYVYYLDLRNGRPVIKGIVVLIR